MIKKFEKEIVPKTDPIVPNDITPQEENMRIEFKYLRGLKGDKGEPGHNPTDEELLALMRPLIPEKAADGHTPTVEELLALMRPLIPQVKNGETPSDERLLSLIQPLMNENEQEELPTIEEIRDQLTALQKGQRLPIQAIDELPEILEKLEKMIKENKGGSRGNNRDLGLSSGGIHTSPGNEIRFIDDETPSGTKDGANTAFILSKTPKKNSLKVYRNGVRQRITEDYTFANKTITFIIAPVSSEIILADYRY